MPLPLSPGNPNGKNNKTTWPGAKVMSFGLLGVLLVAFALSRLALVQVSGTSMAPEFPNGWKGVLVKGFKLKAGDYVSFEEPSSWRALDGGQEEGQHFLKQAVAVEGDTLKFDGSVFTVNGTAVSGVPQGVNCSGRWNYSHLLSKNEVFVVGKDFNQSLDSRRAFCGGLATIYVERDSIIAFGSLHFP